MWTVGPDASEFLITPNGFILSAMGIMGGPDDAAHDWSLRLDELIAMAKKFKEEAARGANAGLNADELAFYDALADNEESVRELGDKTLRTIAQELAESLRKNVSVDWAVRESVRAKLRLMVRRILRKYKYPPVKQDAAVALVLPQAEALSAEWA